MIDYEKKLHQFFAELTAYLEKVKTQIRPGDIQRLSDINYGLMVVGTVALDPRRYVDVTARVQENLEKFELRNAFIPENSRDGSVFVLYRIVIVSLGDLYAKDAHVRENARQKLLTALELIKYKNSKTVSAQIVNPSVFPAHRAIKQGRQYS